MQRLFSRAQKTERRKGSSVIICLVIHVQYIALATQKAAEVSKMEAELERLRRDRGEGEPMKLVESAEGKEGRSQGAVAMGRPIEIRLGGGGEDESEDDSDDISRGGEDESKGIWAIW